MSTPRRSSLHYSKGTTDIEYRFNFAGSEWASLRASPTAPTSTCRRTPSTPGTDLVFFDQTTNSKYTPHVIEPAGLSRSLMTFLVDAYTEDEAPNTKGGVRDRVVLRLDPRLAPVKAAVLPLSRNEDLSPKARDLAAQLRRNWNIDFDDSQAIGKRYRRQDEIGTPFCITVDFDTLDDQAVTIRERDSMQQEGRPRPGRGLAGPTPRGLLTGSGMPRSSPQRAGLLLTLVLAGMSMLGPFDRHALPGVREDAGDFGVGAEQMQLVVSAYMLAFAVMTPFHGPLSDAIGRKPVIIGALTAYAVASVGCALSPNLSVLLFFRVLQGLSAGGSTIIGRRSSATSSTGPGPADDEPGHDDLRAGSGGRPDHRGLLLRVGPWPAIFWFIGGFALLLGAAVVAVIPETHPAERRRPLRLGPMLGPVAGRS